MVMDELLEAAAFVGILLIVTFAIFAIPIGGLIYFSSCRQAAIYNAQNNTSYTCGDFFWAAEQINARTQTVKVR